MAEKKADLLAPDSDDEPPAKVQKTGAPEQPAAKAEAAPAAAAAAAAPAADEKPAYELKTGMTVELVGFASSAMNGAKGKLGKFAESKGIWQVFLEGTTAAKAVKAKNLKPVAGKIITIPSTPGPVRQKPTPKPVEGQRGEFDAIPKPKFVNFKTTWSPDDNIPMERDEPGWLEVMRDLYTRQLREIHSYPDPPHFHTIFEPVSDPAKETTKSVRQALTLQLQILTRARYGEGGPPDPKGKGKSKGPPRDGPAQSRDDGGKGDGKPIYPWQTRSAPVGRGGKGPPPGSLSNAAHVVGAAYVGRASPSSYAAPAPLVAS